MRMERQDGQADRTWRRSSSCTGADATCVEVAASPAEIAVRDGKDPGGPVLVFSPTEWRAFVRAVAAGEFSA